MCVLLEQEGLTRGPPDCVMRSAAKFVNYVYTYSDKITLRFWRLGVPLSVLFVPAAPRTSRHLGCGAFKELDTARLHVVISISSDEWN